MINEKLAFHGKSAQGFSLLEVFIVVVLVVIIVTFSVIGITQARSSSQLTNAGDTLKIHLEKAIADAKRRHALGNARATIQVTSPGTYQVMIDFDGDGNLENRTVTLPAQARFVYDPSNPPRATVDWRGNVAEGNVTFTLRSDRNENLAVELTSQGDSSINNEYPALPTVFVTTTSTDVNSSTVLNGNSSPNPSVSPTPSPTPLPYCTSTQKPADNDCRCQPGQTIDDKNGRCK